LLDNLDCWKVGGLIDVISNRTETNPEYVDQTQPTQTSYNLWTTRWADMC